MANTEEDGIDGGQGFLVVGRGAAHSNTQEKRDKSGNRFVDYRESTEGKGTKVRQKRQRQKT